MVSILHAADLHLDAPFSGLAPQQAAQRRALQRQLPMELTELANRLNCQLLLLAGDVFDGSRICPETVEALQTAFSAFRGKVFIAPGNHDPYTEASPWASAVWPDNVHIFKGQAEAVTLSELGCRIWGGGFTANRCDEGLPRAEWQGLLEIGLFHGDPETTGPYRAISQQEIRESGLNYLALGHIHKTAMPRLAGTTWYGWPGAAMGRGFDEIGPRGVFHVVLDTQTCSAEFLPLPFPRYEIIRWPVGVKLEDILPPDSENVICRLIRTGQADGTVLPDLNELFYQVELQDETIPERDLWQDCETQTLKGLALKRLKQQYDSARTEEQRQKARLAAKYVIAALEGRELP